jgi:arsenite methyltransferase
VLLTLGAAERAGADGDVLAIDISVDVLEELRAHCAAPNVSYLVGSADVIPLPDATVDVVMTRSVLIYVSDKAEVAREFERVLRSGGRVSLFEPINRHNLQLWQAIDLTPLGEIADRMREWTQAYYANPDDAMLNFDETDLVRVFAGAGLADVHVELRTEEDELPGERYLNQVGAPGRPTLLARMRDAFPDDAERLAAFIGERTIPWRVVGAFLTARKP